MDFFIGFLFFIRVFHCLHSFHSHEVLLVDKRALTEDYIVEVSNSKFAITENYVSATPRFMEAYFAVFKRAWFISAS